MEYVSAVTDILCAVCFAKFGSASGFVCANSSGIDCTSIEVVGGFTDSNFLSSSEALRLIYCFRKIKSMFLI